MGLESLLSAAQAAGFAMATTEDDVSEPAKAVTEIDEIELAPIKSTALVPLGFVVPAESPHWMQWVRSWLPATGWRAPA
jgi:hypothetical protein